jgi:lipopolysaccharide export system permease protein
MNTLDRYITRQFLINFVILFFVLITLFVMFDLILDMDEFLKAGDRRKDELGGRVLATIILAADYYLPLIVLVYAYFPGLLVVAAMAFTYLGLSRTGELVAMVTGGLSMYRLAVPVVVAGFCLNLLALPAQEYLVPRFASKVLVGKSQIGEQVLQKFPVYYTRDGHNNLVSAASFDTSTAQPRMLDLTVLVRDATGQATSQIVAKQAWWNEQRRGWDLDTGYVLHPGAQATGQGDAVGGRHETIPFYQTDLTPDVLLMRRAEYYVRLLSLQDLIKMATNAAVTPQQRYKMTRVVWCRFSILVCNMLIQILCLPVIMSRDPRSPLRQAAAATGVCIGSWFLVLLLLELDIGALNAVTAAWLPVAVIL